MTTTPTERVDLRPAATGDHDGGWHVRSITVHARDTGTVWLDRICAQSDDVPDISVDVRLTPAGLTVVPTPVAHPDPWDEASAAVGAALHDALERTDALAYSRALLRTAQDGLEHLARGNPLAHGGGVDALVRHGQLCLTAMDLPTPEARAAALAILAAGGTPTPQDLRTAAAAATTSAHPASGADLPAAP